jgi:hypothetical protein
LAHAGLSRPPEQAGCPTPWSVVEVERPGVAARGRRSASTSRGAPLVVKRGPDRQPISPLPPHPPPSRQPPLSDLYHGIRISGCAAGTGLILRRPSVCRLMSSVPDLQASTSRPSSSASRQRRRGSRTSPSLRAHSRLTWYPVCERRDANLAAGPPARLRARSSSRRRPSERRSALRSPRRRPLLLPPLLLLLPLPPPVAARQHPSRTARRSPPLANGRTSTSVPT